MSRPSGPPVKGGARIVFAHFRTKPGDVAAGNVGRIADDEIERAVDAVERVGPREVNALRNAERCGVQCGRLQGLAADVRPHSRRQRQLGEQRQQQASRPGADVEDADRPLAPTLARRDAERRLDEGLAIGARIERRRRKRKAAAVELPLRRGCARQARARSAARRIACSRACSSAARRRSGRAMISAVSTPAAAATRSRASRPASSTPAAASARCTARAASPSVSPSPRAAAASGIFHVRQLARLVVGDQRVDQLVERRTLQHRIELVQRHVDAMVGDAPLREVVGADALRAIA